jgi:hypothetical protein
MVCEFHVFHVARPGSAATLVAPRPIGPLIRLMFAGQKGQDLKYVVFLSFFFTTRLFIRPVTHLNFCGLFSQEFIRKNDLLLE